MSWVNHVFQCIANTQSFVIGLWSNIGIIKLATWSLSEIPVSCYFPLHDWQYILSTLLLPWQTLSGCKRHVQNWFHSRLTQWPCKQVKLPCLVCDTIPPCDADGSGSGSCLLLTIQHADHMLLTVHLESLHPFVFHVNMEVTYHVTSLKQNLVFQVSPLCC